MRGAHRNPNIPTVNYSRRVSFPAPQSEVSERECVLISLHSSALSGRRCWLRLSGQVSLLPRGRAIHYSQRSEKSGRKIRNHRPTELGSIDCTFPFRSTHWPVASRRVRGGLALGLMDALAIKKVYAELKFACTPQEKSRLWQRSTLWQSYDGAEL